MFMPKPAEQSWDDVIEAMEEAAEADSGDSGGRPDPDSWSRIVEGARGILGAVSVADLPTLYELTDENTGIQIQLYAGVAGLSVPYWYQGEAARTIAVKIYRLAAVIAESTGLAGYDPQLELDVVEATGHIDDVVACFDQVAASFAARGIETPSAGVGL